MWSKCHSIFFWYFSNILHNSVLECGQKSRFGLACYYVMAILDLLNVCIAALSIDIELSEILNLGLSHPNLLLEPLKFKWVS